MLPVGYFPCTQDPPRGENVAGLIDELVDGGALTVVGPEVTSARAYYVVWPKDRRSVETDALVAWLRTEAAS